MSKTSDYSFGNKNNWRRFVWNQLKERIIKTVLLSDATVMYLAGEEDLDRKIATSKGFKNINLIAVDRCLDSVNNVRFSGGLAINGDIKDVLFYMSQTKTKIHGLSLDFCCGVSDCIADLALRLSSGVFNSVFGSAPAIVVNFMRGRDAGAILNITDKNEKHRGKKFYNFLTGCIALSLLNSFGYEEKIKHLNNDQLSKTMEPICVFIDNLFKPCFYSYRGDGVVMDSCVFTMSLISNLKCKDDAFLFGPQKNIKTNISAFTATRTIKANKLGTTINRKFEDLVRVS